jgi:hypothetical protein
MIVELLPRADSPGHRAIAALVEGLRDAGVPVPPRVLVDDGQTDWRSVSVALPVESRRRTVLATASERSLWQAVVLEIGGATWLPASTPSLEDACAAASAAEPLPLPQATWGVLESAVAGAKRLWGVGWPPLPFWNRQIGSIRMLACLRRIADELRCLPAVVPGPILVVAGTDRDRVEEACRGQSAADRWGPIPPAVVDLAPILALGSGQRAAGVIAALRRWSAPGGQFEKLAFPVMELPSGRAVGHWLPPGSDRRTDGDWRAIPDRDHPDGARWHVDGRGMDLAVRELTASAEIGVGEHEILRLSGRIGAELRRGSPAALLAERIARHEARGGRPLWISGVDADGVRFLLGLPGPVWVDGPGVPRD